MLVKTILPLLLVATVYAEVPSFIHICCRQDPELNKCIVNSVQGLRDHLESGIPELDVPPGEPASVGKVVVADFDNFKASADNVQIYGLTHYKVKNLDIDLDKHIIKVACSFDRANLVADYDINTRIVVPIAGNGKIELNATDIDANVTMTYNLVERNGKQYLFFQSVTTKLTIGDFNPHFQDRNLNETTLSTAINTTLKNTRAELIERTTPNIEKAISAYLLQSSNKICQHFTYDELFPNCS